MEIIYDKINFELFKVTDDIKGNKYRNAIHDIPLMAMIDAYNAAKNKEEFDKVAMGKAVVAQMTDIFIASMFSKEESNKDAFNPGADPDPDPDPESEIKKPVTNITVDMNSSRAIFNWTPVKGQTKWYLMVDKQPGLPDFNRVVEKIPYTEEKLFKTGTYSITVKAIISGTSEDNYVYGEPATITHEYSNPVESDTKSVHTSNQSIEIENAEAQPKDNVVENQEPISTMANKKQQSDKKSK